MSTRTTERICSTPSRIKPEDPAYRGALDGAKVGNAPTVPALGHASQSNMLALKDHLIARNLNLMQPAPTIAASEPSTPASSADAAARIHAFTAAIVREALTVRALVDTLKGAKKFIEQAAREYAERFLFELIQNAYDAQPPASRGRVLVVFDATEGEFGCVYVANTGRPFNDANFRAVCEVAQSSKRPGEGIGNKGVGFKSVLQVAAWPEIYSRGSQGDGFDGYCFRFADPAAMRTLTANDEEAADLGDRISPYGLPIYIAPAEHPVRLSEFADGGYVSVIRLPC